MTKQSSKIIAFAAVAGLVAGLTGCRTVRNGQSETDLMQSHSGMEIRADYPLDSQIAELKQPVTFSIAGKFTRDTHHQWFFNGSLIDSNSVAALGVTGYDSPNLRIESASLANCGFYSYQNELKNHSESSATAQLLIVEHQEARLQALSSVRQTITVVYGTPVAGGGSGTGSCPGTYKGYVQYPGSYYFPRGGQATDGGNSGNTVVHYGVPFTNHGCSSSIPPSSYPYHFYIYFKNSVPSGPYPLKLVCF